MYHWGYMYPRLGTPALAQSAAELWLAKVCPKRANYAFSEKCGIRPGQKLGFWPIILAKSIKGSIDTDFDLVFNKTFESKQWVSRLGLRAGQYFQNTATCGGPPSKPPTKNEKSFFFYFNQKTCWICRGFEQLSSSSELWPKKCQLLYWLARDVKR